MIFQHMTWQEMKSLDFDRTLVLIPLGAIEQHGPHLPVDTDTRIVTAFAEEVERRLADRVLLTPTIWLGHSPHHLSFGGTLSAPMRLFADQVIAVAGSCIGMGATNIWLLNGHGGNRLPLSIVLHELKDMFAHALITSTFHFDAAKDDLLRIRESPLPNLGHADEMETSLYLYLHEQGVRKPLIRDGSQSAEPSLRLDLLQGIGGSRVFRFDELTDNGVYGWPTKATKAKGERIFQAVGGQLVAMAQKLLEERR